MARMTSRLRTSFAEIALSRSQEQRYLAYSKIFSEDKEDVIFDDRMKSCLFRYVNNPNHAKADLKGLNELVCEEDGLKFSRSYFNHQKMFEAIEKFSMPNHRSFRYNQNYQGAVEEMCLEFSKAQLNPLHFLTSQDLRDALPKENTNSGFLYLETGKRRKGDNIEETFSTLPEFQQKAKSMGNFGVPILVSKRTQGSAHDEFSGKLKQKGKHKTRLVCMVDLRVIASELSFSKPIQHFLSREVDWYSGGKTPEELRNLVRRDSRAVNHWVSLDFSSFDQTISDWLIEDAFKIIKSGFSQLSTEDEALLDVVRDSFIHKDFLLAEGEVKHVDKGVPSGSMFTQIVDSIVNRLMILTFLRAHSIVFRRLGHVNNSNIMGDDHLLATTDHVDLDDLAGYLASNFGVVMNPSKCVTSDVRGENPWFLSREFRPVGEWRHPNVLLDHLLFPERFRPYDKSPVKPEDIIYCMIQTYPLGMAELISIEKFMKDYNPREREKVLSKEVDGTWLPGSYMFIRDYVLNDRDSVDFAA